MRRFFGLSAILHEHPDTTGIPNKGHAVGVQGLGGGVVVQTVLRGLEGAPGLE